MSAPSSPQLLYRIDECGDVMADACVCGEDGDLVFLSVWLVWLLVSLSVLWVTLVCAARLSNLACTSV